MRVRSPPPAARHPPPPPLVAATAGIRGALFQFPLSPAAGTIVNDTTVRRSFIHQAVFVATPSRATMT